MLKRSRENLCYLILITFLAGFVTSGILNSSLTQGNIDKTASDGEQADFVRPRRFISQRKDGEKVSKRVPKTVLSTANVLESDGIEIDHKIKHDDIDDSEFAVKIELYKKFLPNSPFIQSDFQSELEQRNDQVFVHYVRTCGPDGCPKSLAWRYSCALESTLLNSHYDVVLSFQGVEQLSLLLNQSSILNKPEWHVRVHLNVLNVPKLLKNTPLNNWYHDTFLQGKAGEFDAINLSDGARLAIIFNFGGLYCDLDTIFLKPFSLGECSGIQLFRAPNNAPTNAYFYAKSGDPSLIKLMNRFVREYDGDKWGHQGPMMFHQEFGYWQTDLDCSTKSKKTTRAFDVKTMKSQEQKSEYFFERSSNMSMAVHYLNQFTSHLKLGSKDKDTVLAQTMRRFCPMTMKIGQEIDQNSGKGRYKKQKIGLSS